MNDYKLRANQNPSCCNELENLKQDIKLRISYAGVDANIALFIVIALGVNRALRLSNQDIFTSEAKWYNIRSLVLWENYPNEESSWLKQEQISANGLRKWASFWMPDVWSSFKHILNFVSFSENETSFVHFASQVGLPYFKKFRYLYWETKQSLLRCIQHLMPWL